MGRPIPGNINCDGPCPRNENLLSMLDDHEDRLREKREKIIRLEMEGKAMMEAIVKLNASVDKLTNAVDDLRVWQIKMLSGFAVISAIVGFVAGNWDHISAAMGVGK